MGESAVEKYLCNAVKERGGLCLKLIIMGKRNFPDRTIFCQNGKIFFIELKDIDQNPRPGQKWFFNLLTKRLGFKVYVCRTKSQVDKALDKEMEAL